jgi:hypothetical protein
LESIRYSTRICKAFSLDHTRNVVLNKITKSSTTPRKHKTERKFIKKNKIERERERQTDRETERERDRERQRARTRVGVVQFGIVIDFELLLAPSGGVSDVELKQNGNKTRLQKKW